MSEGELLRRWQSGDPAAGEALVRAHYRPIYQFFYGKVGASACPDLTQETFETLCSKRDEFAGDSTIRTYLFAIARNKLANHLRARWKDRHADPADSGFEGPDPDPSFTSLFDARHREALVVRALRSLDLDDQLVLELKDYEGVTARELATIFEAAPGTIAGRIHRARGRLREAVQRLAADAQDVEDTLTSLDECMRQIRERVSDSLATIGAGPRSTGS